MSKKIGTKHKRGGFWARFWCQSPRGFHEEKWMFFKDEWRYTELKQIKNEAEDWARRVASHCERVQFGVELKNPPKPYIQEQLKYAEAEVAMLKKWL